VVYGAAVVTWVAATLTAALAALLAVALLTLLGPAFGDFGAGSGNPRWWVVGGALVVVVLAAAADLAAFCIVRGRRWARWLLMALSVVAIAGGIVSAYYIAPLIVTAACISVVVLLVLPDSRAWFRGAGRHP
jgi:hypothetical protein